MEGKIYHATLCEWEYQQIWTFVLTIFSFFHSHSDLDHNTSNSILSNLLELSYMLLE